MGGGDRSQGSSSKNNSSGRNYSNRKIRTRGKNFVLCNCGLRMFGVHCNFFHWTDGYKEQSVVQVAQEVFIELNCRIESLENSISTLKMLMLLLLCIVITIGFGFGI
ncbi:hypothetical protein AHAS_Ahas05G0069200 [Arachis hypogaea]